MWFHSGNVLPFLVCAFVFRIFFNSHFSGHFSSHFSSHFFSVWTVSKYAFIFGMCFHFQNVLSFSKRAFIFKTCFHFQNVLSFSKCDLNEHYFLKNTTSSLPISLQFLNYHFTQHPKISWTFVHTPHKSLLHFQKKIWKRYFCWNIYHFTSIQLSSYLLPILSHKNSKAGILPLQVISWQVLW